MLRAGGGESLCRGPCTRPPPPARAGPLFFRKQIKIEFHYLKKVILSQVSDLGEVPSEVPGNFSKSLPTALLLLLVRNGRMEF